MDLAYSGLQARTFCRPKAVNCFLHRTMSSCKWGAPPEALACFPSPPLTLWQV